MDEIKREISKDWIEFNSVEKSQRNEKEYEERLRNNCKQLLKLNGNNIHELFKIGEIWEMIVKVARENQRLSSEWSPTDKSCVFYKKTTGKMPFCHSPMLSEMHPCVKICRLHAKEFVKIFLLRK